MAYVYLALVDTPGLFASAIRRFLHQKYVHVVLSLDEHLDEAYSFRQRSTASAGLRALWNRRSRSGSVWSGITAGVFICITRFWGCPFWLRERNFI